MQWPNQNKGRTNIKTLQFLAAMLLLLLAAYPLYAQTGSGAISGLVTDSTGAVIPGATVKITNEQTGVVNTLKTDSRGFYSDEGLSVGQYRVDTSKQGFEQNVVVGVQLDPGQRRANNVVLKVGTVSTKVTVTANALQVNTETSESGGTVTSQQISNLMLNGRDFQTLAIAIPGVANVQGANGLAGSGAQGNLSLIFNGNSVEYSTYLVDGVMISDSTTTVNVMPVPDGISEFKVLNDSYSARYGLSGSGQVVIDTKTGTSTFHGSAWDYLRNNAFDAMNYFATSTPPLHQNIFGYTLGGPLIIPGLYNTDRSRKTFFFASNQWQLIDNGTVTRGAVFPQAMRGGDFSSSPTLPSSGVLTLDANSQALLASEGKTGCITGPTTLNPTCLDPIAVALLKAYVPLPNNVAGGFQNYINLNPVTSDQLDYQYRIDHQINSSNQVMARFMYEPLTTAYPYNWLSYTSMPYTTLTDSYYTAGLNALIRVTSNITSNLINTASVADTYAKYLISSSEPGQMPSGLSIIQSFPGADPLNRIPNISIGGGWSGAGEGPQPIHGISSDFIVQDEVSWVHGKHVFQAGALYLSRGSNGTSATFPQGEFSFSGTHTGDPAADFMLGLDSSYSQNNVQNDPHIDNWQSEIYVQDDWRATPRLTLNLGMRWQFFSAATVSGNDVASFDPAQFDPSQAPLENPNGTLQVNSQNQPITASGSLANLENGLVFAGKNGVPDGFFNPSKTGFGPRVGFAYDVYGNGMTSIRGGYGIGYSTIPGQQMGLAAGANPPFNQDSSISNSLLSNGTAGTAGAPSIQTLNAVLPSYTPAQIQSYSLTLEQQVKRNMVASIAYAGSQSRHLSTLAVDLNGPPPVSAPSLPGCLPAGQAPSTHYDFDPCINSGAAGWRYESPYQGWNNINYQYDEGTGNYNALQSALNYRAGASQFSLAYTWSKALSTVGPGGGAAGSASREGGVQNQRDLHAEYGPPAWDFTNDIAATWVYAIPYFAHGDKFTTAALGNWSFAGLALHQSGYPLTPNNNLGTDGAAVRTNQIAPYRQLGKLSEWFDTSSYAASPYGFYGDASNGSIRGPGYTSFNTALYKSFPIKERFSTQFRAEAFNVLNHPNFNNVDTGLGDGSYGQVTSAGDPRILEFALKVLF